MATEIKALPAAQDSLLVATDRPVWDERSDDNAEDRSSTPTKDPQERFYTVFFRALGLSVVNYTLGLIGHKSFKEPPKVILRRNWTVVFLRNLVHLIPSVAALQFAAKLHKIFMVASLSQIVLYMARSELVSGDGLPFGALVSGLQFSQLSYLWSLELWGLATSPSFLWWRKIRFVLIAVVCVILAASAGPSSAIAMIPRVGYWPAGVTSIWLNGTNDELFPQRVSADGILKSCINSSSVSREFVCPSSGWQDISDLSPFERDRLGPGNSNWPSVSHLLNGEIGFPSSMQPTGKSALRTLYLCTDLGGLCIDTLATTQYAATADAAELVGRFWIDGLSDISDYRLKQYTMALHTVETSQPFVSVHCTEGGIIFGPQDEAPIIFPAHLPSKELGFGGNISVTTVPQSEIFNTLENPANPRLVFVDLSLSSNPSNATSLGALILDARDAENMTQVYTSCLIGGGWGRSHVNTSIPNSKVAALEESVLEKLVTGTGFQMPFLEHDDEHPSENYYFEDFPLQMIALSKEWADYINPFIPELNATAFSAINTGTGNDPDYPRAMFGYDYVRSTPLDYLREMVVASLIANGLSNLGLNFTMQGNLTLLTDSNDEDFNHVIGALWILHNQDIFTLNPGDGADWVKLKVYSYINGYSYNSDGVVVRIALGILLAYGLIATIFVICTSFRGISSSAWDSISELTALAMNSEPTAELKNTCGGITSLNTYKLMARVELKDREKNPGSGLAEQAQLVFRKGKRPSATAKIELNKKYGSLSAG